MESLPVELLPLITADARSWVMMSRTNRTMAGQMRKMIYSYTADLHFDSHAINTRAYMILIDTVLETVHFIYHNGKEVFFATHSNMIEQEMLVYYMFGKPAILKSVASTDVLFAVGIFNINYKPVKLTPLLPEVSESRKNRGNISCKEILSGLRMYKKDIVLGDIVEAPQDDSMLLFQHPTRSATAAAPLHKKSNNTNATHVGVLTQQGQGFYGMITFHDGHTLGIGDNVVIVGDEPMMSTLRGRELLRRIPQLAGHVYDVEPLFADEW